MEAVTINKLFSINWHCESGLVDNVELVVEEYRQARGLLPLRLCILGPPAVGKSSLSKEICQHYKLHHITLKETLSEAITRLVSRQEQIKLLRDKLMSNPCRNQGYVLDDFPNTYEQANELFEEDQDESSSSRRIMPGRFAPSSLVCFTSHCINMELLVSAAEFLLCLDASDSFLTDRVINLPEEVVQELDYEPEQFLSRLAIYRGNNQEDKTVLNFFEELDVRLLYLGNLRRDNMCRYLKEGFSTQSSEEAMLKEEQDLENLTVQMRSYLMEHVMPTLSQGLIECCRAQPPDPLEFLAEYLFRNNPLDQP
ncbi:hypothetical protein GOODEAATRI_008774 [Goodea atripinnis]|uniref:Nucleoside-diphosphate kinase n=1 Tax=Goodea atripinnis TaxID=208336 RepID=A0ABV0PM62_9TELE